MVIVKSNSAFGVEIDVRLTKDDVPVIFHDSFLSIHTTKDMLYGGLVHNYTLAELKKIELRKGGEVPTLRETLHTIFYATPLETVWLDIKNECDLREIRKLQLEYAVKAAAIGRTLNIYIGIPDKKVFQCFTQLADYQQAPSLTELDPEVAVAINAQVWAPQYTKGFQEEEVDKVHAASRKIFLWSLDDFTLIDTYMKEGNFDGVVTNAPTTAAHWFYTSSYRNDLAKHNERSLNDPLQNSKHRGRLQPTALPGA
jgi:glycerophosphoryl diester phosphodiesterase